MKKIFMVVDDDPDDRFFFKEAISRIDPMHECVELAGGAQAMQYLKDSDILPDYIFLDINMPVMDGKKVLGELKKDERLKTTPVIMYSSSTYQPDLDESKQLGAKAYLVKPMVLADLPHQIMSVL